MADSNDTQSPGISMFPDPVNPDDPGRGPLVMGLTWTFSSLALIVVIVRFWVRVAVTKILTVEDWLMLAAVVGFSLSFTSPQGIVLAGSRLTDSLGPQHRLRIMPHCCLPLWLR